MLFSKIEPTTKINFVKDVIQSPRYKPDPKNGQYYLVKADNLATTKIINIKGNDCVRVAIAHAKVPKVARATVGADYVILLDKATAKALDSLFPWVRNEILALIAMENARIRKRVLLDEAEKGHVVDETSAYSFGFTQVMKEIDEAPEYAFDLLEAGTIVGANPALRGAHRQNKTIEKSLKPIMKQLHKAYKAEMKQASAGEAADPDEDDDGEEPEGIEVDSDLDIGIGPEVVDAELVPDEELPDSLKKGKKGKSSKGGEPAPAPAG